MRHRLDWRPRESLAARSQVLRLQGIAPGQAVPPRIEALLDRATALYLDLAQPRAIVAEIESASFSAVYRGAGRNSHETPLEAIFPRAERLALAAATVGGWVSERIDELFDRRDPALACMLDSVASAAADGLADLLGPWYLSTNPGPPDWHVLVYSPGYCGWDVSGQRALFDVLRPEEIGITLNESCLMQPLKSISGVLVAGFAHIHRFQPAYSFCERCREKQCRERIASLAHR